MRRFLALVGAAFDIADVATGGNLTLRLLAVTFALSIGATFTRRGLRNLRNVE